MARRPIHAIGVVIYWPVQSTFVWYRCQLKQFHPDQLNNNGSKKTTFTWSLVQLKKIGGSTFQIRFNHRRATTSFMYNGNRSHCRAEEGACMV
jgi:hypothetical protein